jgi:hypothetical protein
LLRSDPSVDVTPQRRRVAIDAATARLWLGVVFRLYRVIHRREPDPSGLIDALRALRDGTPLATLIARAFESDEFAVGSLPVPASTCDIDRMFQAVDGAAPSLPTNSRSLPVAEYAATLLIAAERSIPTLAEELLDLTLHSWSPLIRLKSALSGLGRRRTCAVEEMIGSIEKQKSDGTCGVEQPGAFPSDAGVLLKDMLLAFESLGDNCEFGLVQRAGGAEPLGLLRFAAIYQPFEQKLERLVTALNRDFEGLGEPGTISFSLFGDPGKQEYFIDESVYSLRYHSGVFEGTVSESELERREVRRLAFLRRKLVEDLSTGEKIWVWKCSATTSVEQIAPLMNVLRRLGPNVLLWVVEATPQHEAGSVERLGPDLLRGYIERFAPYEDATNIAPDTWFGVCRSAYQIVRGDIARVTGNV